MEKIKQLLDRVDIRVLIEKDFELRDYGTYSKGILHDSLVVDHNKNYFYWNSIELRGNALDWLTTVKGLPVVDAVKQLKELVGELPSTKTFEYPLEVNIYPKLLDVFYELGKTNRTYWYEKGYSDSVIDRFRLGFTGKFYTIPIVFGGKLLNFQCKIPKIGDKPKRIWSWASGVGVLPFNFDILPDTKSVFITESPGDAIYTSQFGFNCISQNGGSNNWLKSWNQYLSHLTEIIICYDRDEAGLLGSLRLARQFEDRAKVLIWPDNYPLKTGLGNLPKEDILKIVLNNSFTLKEIEPYKNQLIYQIRKEQNDFNK